MMKRALTGILAVILICIVSIQAAVSEPGNGTGTAFAGNSQAEQGKTDENKPGTAIESDVLIETDTLAFTYEYETNTLKVKDKVSGCTWHSTVQEDMYDIGSANKTWQANMKSLFIMAYTNFKEDRGRILKVQSGAANMEVSLTGEGNTLRAEYSFPELEMAVTLEFILDDDTLIVRIPEDGIREDGIHGIVGLEIMPFMGAAKNGTEGYMLVPDGSGALVMFEEKAGQAVSGGHRLYAYGPELVEVQRQRFDPETEGIETVLLPVYGIKSGDSAFIAYITDNGSDAGINMALSGYAVALNRIYAEFTYRRTYNASRAHIDLRGDLSEQKVDYKVIKEMIPGDREIRYTFLRGDKADYSGMACAYRDYLLGSGKMIRNEHKLSLALDLFMGIKERRIIFDYFVKMTDFQQAKDIIEELYNLGVDKMQVNLVGWTSGGYGSWPGHFPVEGKLGGERRLRELSEYIREIGGTLYLQCNYIDAYAENGGYSKRNDTVKQGNSETVTNADSSRFLMNPVRAYAKLKSDLDDFSRVGISGISFERIGSYTYYDYNKKMPVTRGETAGYMAEMVSAARERIGSAAVRGGNAYVLAYADRLFDIPMNCSGYLVYDESVPFYQIVVHGSIPYTSQPGNLFYDFEKQKLQWVEYGCLPYFMLTYEHSYKLKNTDYNHLFTSHFSEWVETAYVVYQEFRSRLDGVWGRLITEHEKLEEDIYRITYDNGSRVYINYRHDTARVEGIEIPPMDYAVVTEGGVTR
jgi:hypothetical protein